MAKIISQDTMLDARRGVTIKETIPFILAGKTETVEKNIVNGEMDLLEMNRPLGEMISYGSVEDLKGLLRKVVLDVEMGKEQVATLYGPIYDTISDANLPEVLDAKWAMSGNCVFLEHMEGQEVKFGSIAAEEGPTARIKTFTTGFEVTKKMIDFNESFKIEMLNKEMGQAYNALLNHIHLGPIVNYTKYKAANKTAYVAPTGEGVPAWVGVHNAIKEGIKKSRLEGRPGNVLVAHSSDEYEIMDALQGGLVNNTNYPKITGITEVIFYDGWSTTVGKKTYTYEGATPGKVHLVRPKQGFKELIKRDYTIEKGNADISRLIEEQIVAHAYRGVFAALDENVQEIEIG